MSYENVSREVEGRLQKARELAEGGKEFAEIFKTQGADLAKKIRNAETVEEKSLIVEQAKQAINEIADVSGVVLKKAQEEMGGYLITSAEEALTSGAEQFNTESTQALDSLQHGVSVGTTNQEEGTQTAFTRGLLEGMAA
jgi:hypothetical protein